MYTTIPGRVLIVQGNEAATEQIHRALDERKIDYIAVMSSKQAMARLESDPSVDLVILGLSSHDPSGLELFRYIKRNVRLQFTPVLVTCSGCDHAMVTEIGQLKPAGIISLPVVEQVLLEKIASALSHGKRSVLVIDDEEVIRDLLADMLHLERLKVYSSGSAEEGLQMLAERPIDIVLSDILLPGMTGMELLVACKERWPGIPVILMTGHSGKYTPREALAAGADGYFTKPFKNVELVRTLQHVLAKYERARRSAGDGATHQLQATTS